MAKKRELHFQKVVIDSYKRQFGYAKKWASDLAVGNPDLVCSFPDVPPHFIEMKHLPTWDGKRQIKNPMTMKQQIEIGKWADAGAMVALGIITGEKAKDTALLLCFPLLMTVTQQSVWAKSDYMLGSGYDMNFAINKYKEKWDGQFGKDS